VCKRLTRSLSFSNVKAHSINAGLSERRWVAWLRSYRPLRDVPRRYVPLPSQFPNCFFAPASLTFGLLPTSLFRVSRIKPCQVTGYNISVSPSLDFIDGRIMYLSMLGWTPSIQIFSPRSSFFPFALPTRPRLAFSSLHHYLNEQRLTEPPSRSVYRLLV